MTDTPRRKRFRVYSIVPEGNPLLVEEFDLRRQAELCIARMTNAYGEIPKDMFLRRPRFTLVDTWEQTAEGAGEVMA